MQTKIGVSEYKVAASVRQHFEQFVPEENPDHDGIPHWPAHNLKERSTLLFDLECKVENDPARKIREILSGL